MPDIELTSAELDELERLAKAATPGPWGVDPTIYKHMAAEILARSPGAERGIAQVWEHSQALPDAAYIASANPATMLRLISLARAGLEARKAEEWLPIETAPRDGTPIVGWCVHEENPYFDAETGKLTDYGCHVEGLGRVDDGAHVLVWGGGDWDVDDSGNSYFWPDWWFRSGSEFEQAANPTHWRPLPAPPAIQALPLTGDKP